MLFPVSTLGELMVLAHTDGDRVLTVKDTKDDEGPPWQLVKNKKNKKMHIHQNTHVKQVNSPNITKRHRDNLQKINKCDMHTCG